MCCFFVIVVGEMRECKPSKLSPYACFTACLFQRPPTTAFSLVSPSVFIFSNKQAKIEKGDFDGHIYDISRDLFATD